jgi:hypothetical protein
MGDGRSKTTTPATTLFFMGVEIRRTFGQHDIEQCNRQVKGLVGNVILDSHFDKPRDENGAHLCGNVGLSRESIAATSRCSTRFIFQETRRILGGANVKAQQ